MQYIRNQAMFAFLSGLFHRGIRVQKNKAEFKSCLYDSPEETELCVAEQMDEEAWEISQAPAPIQPA